MYISKLPLEVGHLGHPSEGLLSKGLSSQEFKHTQCQPVSVESPVPTVSITKLKC